MFKFDIIRINRKKRNEKSSNLKILKIEYCSNFRKETEKIKNESENKDVNKKGKEKRKQKEKESQRKPDKLEKKSKTTKPQKGTE
jgi:hypothetical protein